MVRHQLKRESCFPPGAEETKKKNRVSRSQWELELELGKKTDLAEERCSGVMNKNWGDKAGWGVRRKNTPLSTCRSPMCSSAQGVIKMSANFSLLRHKVGQGDWRKMGVERFG